ncbi:MAG: IS21 family transposase [Planctomycetaceae bacterium]|nr:IS21 family transposase [Planctomycetaceae bacterium]
MITDMDRWTDIRRDVLVDGMSMREACKKYHLNFRTIQKILSHAEPPGYCQRATRDKPTIGPFIPIIHEILEADKKVHKKQRHTGKRIFDRLRDEHGYTGGITVVRDEIRRWKRSSTEVFMPLSHPPGEAQFDFGEAKAIYRGREIKVMFCVMSLPYSDAFFCQAFPRECTETFQEGHVRAFEFFGGVPKRISYDNSKIAVAKIVGRRGEERTKEFLRLQSHYLYEHHFCLVRRPNEKGHTEGLVKFSRSNFMVPIPRFDDFEDFNRKLAEDCRQDLHRKLRGKGGMKVELLEDDRQAMLRIPEDCFEARRVENCKVNNLSQVRFDRNDYSVPTQYAYRKVVAVGSLDRVRVVADSHLIAEHVRDWESENVHYEPVHYLALLERKPNSLDFGKPFEAWDLPDAFTVLRRRLESDGDSDGRREFIKVLRLLENHKVKELADAIDRALEIGAMTVDVIKILVQEGRESPAKLFRLDDRPHLQDYSIPEPQICKYSGLIQHPESQHPGEPS